MLDTRFFFLLLNIFPKICFKRNILLRGLAQYSLISSNEFLFVLYYIIPIFFFIFFFFFFF